MAARKKRADALESGYGGSGYLGFKASERSPLLRPTPAALVLGLLALGALAGGAAYLRNSSTRAEVPVGELNSGQSTASEVRGGGGAVQGAPPVWAPDLAEKRAAVERAERAALEGEVARRTAEVRALKFVENRVMETDPVAIEAIQGLQAACRRLVTIKYGQPPYVLALGLRFPRSMPDYDVLGPRGLLHIEMAPLELMPYAILTFLDMASSEFTGGAFMRNAPHVKQGFLYGRHPGFPLAFQEYSPQFPHVKYSLGFAGRPSSDGFYISTVDNTVNHGPGSQDPTSKTEADACFAKVVGTRGPGGELEGPFVEVVRRLEGQPGGEPPNGFISDPAHFVKIETLTLLRS